MKNRHRNAERKPSRDEARDRPERRPHAEPASRAMIYGLLPVLEALRANPRRIERIAIAEGSREHRFSEIAALARENGVRVEHVPRENLARIAGDVNHQGIVAFTASAEYVLPDEILDNAGDIPLFVLLDGVEDPRNLGAVLRTSECAGADGVFIPERRAVGLTDTVAKSAAGATEYIKVAKVTNLNRLIDELKQRGIWVVGTSGDAEQTYDEWDWRQPSALVMGSEGSGLHRLTAEKCDILVKIPMHGKISSLNVSVAAGVILFEAMRQRASGE